MDRGNCKQRDLSRYFSPPVKNMMQVREGDVFTIFLYSVRPHTHALRRYCGRPRQTPGRIHTNTTRCTAQHDLLPRSDDNATPPHLRVTMTSLKEAHGMETLSEAEATPSWPSGLDVDVDDLMRPVSRGHLFPSLSRRPPLPRPPSPETGPPSPSPLSAAPQPGLAPPRPAPPRVPRLPNHPQRPALH